jgi:hypothetical protein
MADKPLRRVTGRFRVREGFVQIPHEEGFRHALDHALARTGWPPGEYADVKVEYSVKMQVVNPGHIVEYCVKLIPPG